MQVYFFIIFILYYIFIGILYVSWKSIKIPENEDTENELPFVSIVVAVRNEEKNILKLLRCLYQQSMPKDKFEVLIIDDDSEDETKTIVNNFLSSHHTNIRILKSDHQSDPKISPKKIALSKGIEHALGEIIVMTDGDCWFDKNWLNSMAYAFHNQQVKFVSGPVALSGNGSLLSRFQILEFASLIGTGGAMINLNYPLMCNGANLAFRKSAFYHVRGYEGTLENSSGDDVFLMQKIHAAYYKSIFFIKNQDAIVKTNVQPTISSLINQRKRWASKWNQYLLPLSWVLPIFLFIHYLSLIAGITFLIMDFMNYWTIGLFIILKIWIDYLFLKKVMEFYNSKIDYRSLLISEMSYPFYSIFFGIIVHFGKYQWKKRSYKV